MCHDTLMLSLSFLPTTAALRRPVLLVGILTLVLIVLTLAADTRGPHETPYIVPTSWRPHTDPVAPVATSDPTVAQRLSTIRKECEAPDAFEQQFGRANLRMTRSYEGGCRRTPDPRM